MAAVMQSFPTQFSKIVVVSKSAGLVFCHRLHLPAIFMLTGNCTISIFTNFSMAEELAWCPAVTGVHQA